MDKYGIFKDGVVVEIFENEEVAKMEFLKAIGRQELVSFRKLRFNELTDDEKIEKMRDKLKDINKYLEDMKGSGRTYYSHTNIHVDELSWLLENAEKYIDLKE